MLLKYLHFLETVHFYISFKKAYNIGFLDVITCKGEKNTKDEHDLKGENNILTLSYVLKMSWHGQSS